VKDARVRKRRHSPVGVIKDETSLPFTHGFSRVTVKLIAIAFNRFNGFRVASLARKTVKTVGEFIGFNIHPAEAVCE